MGNPTPGSSIGRNTLIAAGMTLACATGAWSQGFRLDSELHETFGASGSSLSFIAYGYDDAGNRIERRGFNGADADAPASGTTTYEYGQGGKLIREVTRSGRDTVSDIAYDYGLSGQAERIEVKGPRGAVRYVDSLAYDPQGLLIRETRFVSGTATFWKRYAYDGSGRRAADTLFEPDSAARFLPTQATTYAYTADGSVAEERRMRNAGGTWFPERSTEMTYAGGQLIRVVTYALAGSAKSMSDSLEITRDAFGNRKTDRAFDDQGALIGRVEYTWRPLTVSLRRDPAGAPRPARSAHGTAWTTDTRGFRIDLRGRVLASEIRLTPNR